MKKKLVLPYTYKVTENLREVVARIRVRRNKKKWYDISHTTSLRNVLFFI